MINQGVTASDRKAFEAWFNAFNIKEMPEYQTIRDFSFAAWQAATAAKEAEIAALKAERDAAMKDAERYRWLRNHGDSGCTGKDGYGGQELLIDERLDAAIDASIAKAEGGAA